MTRRQWERLGASTGIVFAGLIAWATLITPRRPQINDGIESIGSYFALNRDDILVQSFLIVLASAFLLWFAGSLRSTLRHAEGEGGRLSSVALAGAIGVAGVGLFGTALTAELAYRATAPGGDPALAQGLFDLSMMSASIVMLPMAVLVGAVSAVAIRTGVLPRTFGVIGAIHVLAALIGVSAPLWDGGYMVPGAGYTQLIAGTFVGWVALTSVMVMMRVPADTPMEERVPETVEFRRAIEYRKAAGS